MADLEYADGEWKSPFPKEWGRPPGDAYSEERSRWVKSKVWEHMAGQPLRTVRRRQLEMLTQLRRALIEERRREAP